MYLGVFTLVAVAGAPARDPLERRAALGIVARRARRRPASCFRLHRSRRAASFFPVENRLHWPLNYWNGLGDLRRASASAAAAAAVARGPQCGGRSRSPRSRRSPRRSTSPPRGAGRGGRVRRAGVHRLTAAPRRRSPSPSSAAPARRRPSSAGGTRRPGDGPPAPAVASEADSAALLLARSASPCVAPTGPGCRYAGGSRAVPRRGHFAIAGRLRGRDRGRLAAVRSDPEVRGLQAAPGRERIAEGDFTRSTC